MSHRGLQPTSVAMLSEGTPRIRLDEALHLVGLGVRGRVGVKGRGGVGFGGMGRGRGRGRGRS